MLIKQLENIRNHISQANIADAIDLLEEVLSETYNEELISDFNQICYRINSIIQDELKGLITYDKAQVEKNKTVYCLLAFLTEIEKSKNGRIKGKAKFLVETRFETEKKIYKSYSELSELIENQKESHSKLNYLYEKINRLNSIYLSVITALGIGGIIQFVKINRLLRKFSKWEEEMIILYPDTLLNKEDLNFYYMQGDSLIGEVNVENFVKNIFFPSKNLDALEQVNGNVSSSESNILNELKDLW